MEQRPAFSEGVYESPDWYEITREIEYEQQESMPRSDLTPFANEYVALRQGIVVGHHSDLLTLREQVSVDDEDVIAWVPQAGTGIV